MRRNVKKAPIIWKIRCQACGHIEELRTKSMALSELQEEGWVAN